MFLMTCIFRRDKCIQKLFHGIPPGSSKNTGEAFKTKPCEGQVMYLGRIAYEISNPCIIIKPVVLYLLEQGSC